MNDILKIIQVLLPYFGIFSFLNIPQASNSERGLDIDLGEVLLPSSHLSIHPSIYPSTHVLIQPATHPLFYASIQPPTHPPIHSSIQPSIYPPIHLSIQPPTHPPTYLSIWHLPHSSHMPSFAFGASDTEMKRIYYCALVAHNVGRGGISRNLNGNHCGTVA